MPAFDLQPRLEGTVALRPLVPEDWPTLFAVASDPLIWAGHPASDRWQEAVFRDFFGEALDSGGALVVVDPQTGAVIGSSRYDTSRAGSGEIEIGWTFLARAYWGGTANAAMKALMVGHALEHYEQVIFLVGADNSRSRRAMAKIGGVLTGRELVTMLSGAPVRHIIYAINREAFANGPLRPLLPG